MGIRVTPIEHSMPTATVAPTISWSRFPRSVLRAVRRFLVSLKASLVRRVRRPPRHCRDVTAVLRRIPYISRDELWACKQFGILPGAMPVLSLQPHLNDAHCTKCEVGGEVVSVSVSHTIRMVWYICPMCGNDWHVSQELPRGRVLPFR